MGQAAQRALAGDAVHYERRRPEETLLYQLVQEHAESFFAQVEAQTGASLPEFVKEEFDAFLECGILAHGFLRLRCAECAHEKRVAFSCKRRGFCPSCGARRMTETAAHLVDHVIPRVPVRQWVVSFPIPLRMLFAAHPQRLTPVLQVIHRVITTFLMALGQPLKQAGVRRSEAHSGAVSLIQRFGSAANLNIHLHCLVLDGVYCSGEGVPVFHEARAPSVDELQRLLAKIITRLMRLLTRQGHLIEEQGMALGQPLRYLAEIETDRALTPLQAASCTYRIALGPRAGQKVLSLHRLPSAGERSTPGLCANLHGFWWQQLYLCYSLAAGLGPHAAVRCGAEQRKALEHLCRYITRPAIANERLKRNGAGLVVLQLKSAYKDGTTPKCKLKTAPSWCCSPPIAKVMAISPR